MNAVKVSIGIPSGNTWENGFGLSLAKLVANFSKTTFTDTDDKPVESELFLLNCCGSILPDLRNDIVEQAVLNGSTHILWLDSDMEFPPDTLNRLLAHGKPVVGANCVKKSRPSEPTAAGHNWKKVFTRQSSTGLEKVESTGTGVLLVEMAAYEAMVNQPEMTPIYAFAWHAGQKRFVGEDVRWCLNHMKLGGEVWIDHDLSKQIRHVGRWGYSHDDVPGWYDQVRMPYVADPVALAAE